MKEKIKKGDVPFAMVAKTVLDDKRLSWKAKGLFAYLYGKPDDYDFAYKRICRDSIDGKASTMAGLKELEKLGYLVRNKLRDGHMEYLINWNVSINPESENRALPESDFRTQPESENRRVRKSESPKIGPLSNIDVINNKELKNNKELAAMPQSVKNTYPKQWYIEVDMAYGRIKKVYPQGKEWGPIQRDEKLMFESGRTIAEIIKTMEVCNEQYSDWTMTTVRMKIADVVAGKLTYKSNQGPISENWTEKRLEKERINDSGISKLKEIKQKIPVGKSI